MPDFGQPATPNYTAPDGLATLGNIMSLKHKQQGLVQQQLEIQGQQQGLQGQAAQVQMTQQDASQRQAAAKFFNDFDLSKHVKDDGTLDLDSALSSPELKATGDLAPTIIQHLVQTKSAQLGAKSQLAGLNNDLRDQFKQTVGGLSSDPDVVAGNATGKGKVIDGIQQFVESGGPDAARIAQVYGPVIQNTPPGQLASQLKNFKLQAQSAGQQLATTTPQPTPVQGKQGLNFVNTNPNAPGPVGAPVGQPVTDQGISPTLTSMPSGSLAVVGPGGPGGPPAAALAGPAGSAPRTAAQDAPAPNAPRAVQEAFSKATEGANTHVEDVRKADNPLDYGNNMQIANQIRKLSKNTDTGPGTETWHHVLGALGAPIGSDNVADYQLLGAYLDRQAAGIRGAMGLPQTNEGGSQSRDIAGNVGYQGKALQDKNDLTQALTEGLHQYRNGLDRVAGFGGQASPQAVNAFKSAWTSNFDPNVFKGELAYQRSKKEGDAFVKSLEPEEAKSLAAKRQTLQALARGQLPQ